MRAVLRTTLQPGELMFWRQFADGRPGNFRNLAIVIANLETKVAFVVKEDFDGLRFWRNLIGFADGRMRFQKAQFIIELDIEGVFQRQIAHTFNANHFGGAKRFLQIFNKHGMARRRAVC